MGLLKTILSAKAVEKAVDYLDSKNRLPSGGQYLPARKSSLTARGAGLATAATQIAKRNPKLLGTLGAGAALSAVASYWVKRKQQSTNY